MQCEGGFQMYHTTLLYYRTDGGYRSLMVVIGKRDRGDGDFRALSETLQLILKYIETHFQMLGIYNAEQRLARSDRCIESGIELGHHT